MNLINLFQYGIITGCRMEHAKHCQFFLVKQSGKAVCQVTMDKILCYNYVVQYSSFHTQFSLNSCNDTI